MRTRYKLSDYDWNLIYLSAVGHLLSGYFVYYLVTLATQGYKAEVKAGWWSHFSEVEGGVSDVKAG